MKSHNDIHHGNGLPRFLQQVWNALRTKHYSYRTEQTYVHWIKRFIVFNGKRHPAEMGEPEIGRFLTHLAVNKNVAASAQNKAHSAILFLCKQSLRELKWILRDYYASLFNNA